MPAATKLNYDIVPDKSPLYTTVDQLNHETADFTVTAQNNTNQPVKVNRILIELRSVQHGADTVQLLLPGSARAIQFPNKVSGPGQATWTVTTRTNGHFELKANGSATFQPGDKLIVTLRNVRIREGATGTALVPVFEGSATGQTQTEVGIVITASVLNAKLWVDGDKTLIEPGGTAMLKWSTNDATSGVLTMPGGSPDTLILDSTNLSSGQLPVTPTADTTYSLTCQGRGRGVTRQVAVSVNSLQMTGIEASKLIAVQGEKVLLRWRTNGDGCTLDDGSAAPDVPSTVPNDQFPDGYPVYPGKPTTYKLEGRKKLSDGFISTDQRAVNIDVAAVSITDFKVNGQTTADLRFADFEQSEVFAELTWHVEHSSSSSLSCVTDPIIPPQNPMPVDPIGKLQLTRTGTYGLEIYRSRRMGLVWTLTCEGFMGPVQKQVVLNVKGGHAATEQFPTAAEGLSFKGDAMPTTQLNYNIVPDKSPLYTTVDQLNQSIADLSFTATNEGKAPVNIRAIAIELMKVVKNVDTVELLLPGSAGGIGFPKSFMGPHDSTWTVTGSDGQFTLKPTSGSATFRVGDKVSFTLTNVVIREGNTGTALAPIVEETDTGKESTEVGIGITQSTLDVRLSANPLLIEPGGFTTLEWTTNDASAGALTLPENLPSSITLDPNTNLTSGQQRVSPIVDTSYSLTCQGQGPNVTQQVAVSVDSLQMTDIETSNLTADPREKVLLRWHTNADACTFDDGSGSVALNVPSTVPDDQFPDGYPVYAAQPTTYKVQGSKKLSDGFISTDYKTVHVDVPPVSITSFLVNGQSSASLGWDDFARLDVFAKLTWQVEHSSSCSLSCVATFPPLTPQNAVAVEPTGVALQRVETYGLYPYDYGGQMVWTLKCEGYNGPVEKEVVFTVEAGPHHGN